MTAIPSRALAAAVLLGCMIVPANVRAADAEVKDGGGFFSAAAIRQANEVLKEIQQRHHRDLVVETFLGVPANSADKVKGMNDAAREDFFKRWAADRMSRLNLKDVYILICKSPGHLQVAVGEAALKKAFTTENRDKLKELLLTTFRKKEYDQGLLDAVKFVRERLDANEPAALPQPLVNRITDYAQFFNPASVKSANDELQSLHQRFKTNVTIETFPAIPADKAKQATLTSAGDRERFFESWIADRARLSNVDGIHILMTKSPGHVQIAVGDETKRAIFSLADRDQLRNLLLARFKDKQFDAGLAEGIKFIRDRFESATPKVASVPPPSKPDKPVMVPTPTTVVPSTGGVSGTPSSPTGQAKLNGAPSGGDTGGIREKASDAVRKATEMGQQEKTVTLPLWKWILYGFLSFLALWICIGLIRALFGHGRPKPPAMPTAPSGSSGGLQPRPTGGYVAGGSAGAGAGYRAPGYQPGGGQPNMGYPAGGPYQAGGSYQTGGGGGGGFMSGLLGGMFGAAAGGWIYDSFGRRQSTGGFASPSTPGSYPQTPHGSGGTSYTPDAGPRVSSTGGDFDTDSGPAVAGGDFDDPANRVASSGGDFGDTQERAGSSGGDFENDERVASGAGGDFAADTPIEDATGGGDFGDAVADAGGSGGDQGGADFDTGGTPDTGGGGDFSGGDTGGGSDAGGGSDF